MNAILPKDKRSELNEGERLRTSIKTLLITLLLFAVSPAWAAKPGKSSSGASGSAGAKLVDETAYTYKLMDGTVVEMSPSQKAIANGLWRQYTPVDLYRLFSPIVVTVACDLGDGQSRLGTGVIMNANTVITNWHVVREAKNIIAWDYNGVKYENGRLGNVNPSVDVACITFDGMHSPQWASFVTDSNWVMPGEAVYTIGAPEGMPQTFTNGMFSGWLANGATFRFTAPTGPGGSGGPVFNAYGQVIGIVRGGFGEGGGLNFGISTNAIFEALKISNQDHPNGFVTGVTNGLELGSKEEIAKDNAASLVNIGTVDEFKPDPQYTYTDIDPVTKQPIQKAQSAGPSEAEKAKNWQRILDMRKSAQAAQREATGPSEAEKAKNWQRILDMRKSAQAAQREATGKSL
jgi:S1-C subfamily serine protease